MKGRFVLVFLVSFALIVFSIEAEEEKGERAPKQGKKGVALSLSGDVKKGLAVYTKNCLACHGAEGKGGVANPGSEDGTVPALNPIEEDYFSSNPKKFAKNLDPVIEHGAKPEGKKPAFAMPAYGDTKALTPQQIADVIAYIISLNRK